MIGYFGGVRCYHLTLLLTPRRLEESRDGAQESRCDIIAETQMEVKMEGRRVTASGLVYLFGEEFAKPAGRFFGGETLLHGGQKVDRKDLANRLF